MRLEALKEFDVEEPDAAARSSGLGCGGTSGGGMGGSGGDGAVGGGGGGWGAGGGGGGAGPPPPPGEVGGGEGMEVDDREVIGGGIGDDQALSGMY